MDSNNRIEELIQHLPHMCIEDLPKSTMPPFEEWPPYTQMIWYFFVSVGNYSTNNEDFNKGLEILRSGKVDIFSEDNQLFRELSNSRWWAPKCRLICNEIMRLTNMTMEDIRVYIAKVKHFDKWSEDIWNEYDNCDCERVCMKLH